MALRCAGCGAETSALLCWDRGGEGRNPKAVGFPPDPQGHCHHPCSPVSHGAAHSHSQRSQCHQCPPTSRELPLFCWGRAAPKGSLKPPPPPNSYPAPPSQCTQALRKLFLLFPSPPAPFGTQRGGSSGSDNRHTGGSAPGRAAPLPPLPTWSPPGWEQRGQGVGGLGTAPLGEGAT